MRLLRRLKDTLRFLRTGSATEPVRVSEPLDDWVNDSLEGPDCTDRVHRRFCRKFDRETKEVYWLPFDEVEIVGSYLKFEGGFHVPQVITVIAQGSKCMELTLDSLQDLDRKAIYLGPLPAIPPSLK